MFRNAKKIGTVSMLAVTLSAAAAAQTTAPWDRRPLGVETGFDARTGTYSLKVGWTYDVLSPDSTPLNLSTQVVLMAGAQTFSFAGVETTANPGGGVGCQGSHGNCGGSCGNSTYDGIANDLFCRPDAEQDCNCGELWLTAGSVSGLDLAPGDQITILLFPATGALFEPDTSNDVKTLTFIPCQGDLDGDRKVGLADLAKLLSNYGKTGATYSQGDVDQNGVVDIADVALLLSLYGSSC